ncbi:adenylate/guanylate cyclase domain-containing protein [candidate division WOR-3 bacterium]|nr:adenylate/guanylate cyclase domain-containing protein [candidate division WOR-3 bacterium]
MRLKKLIHKFISPLTVGILWSASTFFLFNAGFLARLELYTSDLRRKFFAFSSGKPSEEIVFFLIDQNSLDIMAGEGVYWPWPRKMTADIIDYLSAGGAKAVVLDVLYTEPSVYGPFDDSSLAISAKNSGNVIVAFMASMHENYFSDTANSFIEKLSLRRNDSGLKLPQYSYFQAPIDLLAENVFMSGCVNIRPDADGIYRGSPLFYRIGENYYPHISLAAYHAVSGVESLNVSDEFIGIYLKEAYIQAPISEDGRTTVNFRGKMSETYRSYTIASVLKSASFYSSGGINDLYGEYKNYLGLFSEYEKIKNKLSQELDPAVEFALFNLHLREIYGFEYDSLEQMLAEIDDAVITSIKEDEFTAIEMAISNFEKNYISPGTFRDKIVFIAGTAPGLLDIRPNPFGPNDAGVFIHASILDDLLSGTFIRERYDKVLIWTFIFLMSLFGSFAGSNIKIQKSIVIFLLALFSYAFFVSFMFIFKNTLVDFSSVPLSLFFSYASGTLIGYVREAREKSFVRNAFGFYLSNKVVNELLSHPDKLKLGGERKFMTAFFSDIAGFTSISETMPPEGVSSLLNEYLSSMCSIISHHEGIVDKFEGDAIIAFWGAPLDTDDHAKNACSCALQMQEKLSLLRSKWEKEGKPPLKMRIGINTGFMVVGNFGSDKRMDYTIIGDSVNLASRLEGVNKFYGTSTIISQTTNEAVEAYFETRKIDIIKVKGKSEPVAIYELVGLKNTLAPDLISALGAYREALELYIKGDFKGSAVNLDNVLGSFPDDGPSNVLLKRCENYIENPPKELWTGIFSLTEK